MKIFRCYICKDEIHPANLKEVIGTDRKKYYFHYICFNRAKKKTDETLGLIQKQIDKIKNQMLKKAIIRLVLFGLLICYIIRWLLTRS